MKTLTFEIYKDKKKEFRWRLKSPNGRIVADCAEGYKRKKTIEKLINDIQWDQIHFHCIDKTVKSKRLGFNQSFVMREHYYKRQIVK